MGHVLACAMFCNPDGTVNGFGTAVAWVLGVPLGVALLGTAVRVLIGPRGRRR